MKALLEAMLTMLPLPERRSAGMAARAQKAYPLTLTPQMASQLSSPASSTVW